MSVPRRTHTPPYRFSSKRPECRALLQHLQHLDETQVEFLNNVLTLAERHEGCREDDDAFAWAMEFWVLLYRVPSLPAALLAKVTHGVERLSDDYAASVERAAQARAQAIHP